MTVNTLPPDMAMAQLLIDTHVGRDPELPAGDSLLLPVYVGSPPPDTPAHIAVMDEGAQVEPATHAGYQLTRPMVRIQAMAETRLAAYDLSMSLQKILDYVGERSVARGGLAGTLRTFRAGGVAVFGQDPKTKLYVCGVTVILTVPQPDPVEELPEP